MIPFFLGKKDKGAVDEVKNQGFSISMLISVVSSILLLIAALVLKNKRSTEVIVGLCAVAICSIISKVCGYYMSLLKAHSEFKILSKVIIFDAVINLILVFSLVKGLRLYGLYIEVIITPLLVIFLILKLTDYRISFIRIKLKAIAKLLTVGFPIYIISSLEGLLKTIDVLMIGKMIGVTSVGYYSLATMSRSYVAQVSNLGTVLKPAIMQAYGSREKIEDIQKFVTVIPKIMAFMLSLLMGMMFIAITPFVKLILPRFIPGILAMQVLLLEIYFRSCSVQAEHFLIALNKQVRLVPLFVGALALNGGLNYLFIKMGYDIAGVALGTSISSFVVFLFIQYYAMAHFARLNQILGVFTVILLPLVYNTAMVLLLQKYVNIGNIYICAIIRIILMVVFYLPFLVYLNKSTGVISILFGMVKKRLQRQKII
jgi:O-antigen/teichoic acid export membrane protein